MNKNRFHVAVLISTMLLMSLSALADREQKITATIPFDFSIGKQTLPAGEYVIKPVNNNGMLVIQDESGKVRATIIALNATDKSGQTQARLTFRQYGQKYFLGHIWSGLSPDGYAMAVSKPEREFASEYGQRLANNTAQPHVVTVRAR